MKKLHWILLAFFSVAAAALRRWQLLTGFDAAGLPVKGNPGGLGLLFLLLAAMAVFILPCLKLRGGRSDEDREMAAYFPAGKTLSAAFGIGGAFLLAASAVLSLLSYRSSLIETLLPVFLLASAAATLFVVFALFRGSQPEGVFLLIPVCYLALHLIFLYREDASDPILSHYAVALLAVAALTAAMLENAAFAFRNGAPRIFLFVGSLAVILSFAAAAELQSLAWLLFFAGFAFVELAFLSGASLRTTE